MIRKIQWLMVFVAFSGLAAFGQQSSVQVTPYGYIKFDSTYDTARTAFGDVAFWVLPETAAGGNEQELNFSARETRFGLNIAAPESRGVKATGRIEVDFYEELTTANKYAPRMRLAYVDLAWNNGWSLRFGQDWDTYVSFHPDMVDANALAFQGHPYGRHPQARLTKDAKLGENTGLTLKLAVQHGRNGSDVDRDLQPDENAANEAFRQAILFDLDVLLQGAAILVAHHHVHGFVGAEEIQHAHHVRMVDSRQRPALFKKAFHAVAEGRQIFDGAGADDVALHPHAERGGHVFLDGDDFPVLIGGAIDNREAASTDLLFDAVIQQSVAR